MACNFSRSRGRLGAQRRETLWAPIPIVSTNITGGGATLVAVASASEDALRPYTIVRTHLHVTIISDQVAATEVQIVAVGLAVVTDQASAIGITAIPTPVTDLESDAWYLHQWLQNTYLFADATGFQDGGVVQMDYDSKAMRRVEDGFDNVLVVEAPSVLSDGFLVKTMGRQLLKLH